MNKYKYTLFAIVVIIITLSSGCGNIIVEEFPICTNSATQGNPMISGNFVVWRDGRNEGYYSIYGYNLETNTEFLICCTATSIINTNIKGNIVTWQQRVDNEQGYETWQYDLDTAIKSMVNDNEVIQADSNEDVQKFDIPTIKDWNPVDRDGNRILYCDYSPTFSLWRVGRAGDLVIFNLENQETFRLPETWTKIYSPRIKGNYVIWIEDIYDEPDIFGYDLVTNKSFTICNKDGMQLNPDIDGNVVVWRDDRNHHESKWDIYGARILQNTE